MSHGPWSPSINSTGKAILCGFGRGGVVTSSVHGGFAPCGSRRGIRGVSPTLQSDAADKVFAAWRVGTAVLQRGDRWPEVRRRQDNHR